MKRVIAVLVAALAAWLGLVQPVEAVYATAAPVIAHTYDGDQRSTPVTNTVNERGPPGFCYIPTHEAVDQWSHGTLARSGAGTSGGAIAYDHRAQLVLVAHGARPTQRRVEVTEGDFVVFDRAGCCHKHRRR